MITKSLPSFQHKSIGAKTHAPGSARKHVTYIMRDSAMTKFQAENMPDGGRGTRSFFDRQWEKAGIENARVADQFIIALPLELNAKQRHEAVRTFMDMLGKGRIAWCAAHHDGGKDAHNPHVHILFKDADIDTGKKVIGTTTSATDVREAKENGWKVPPRMTTRDLRYSWCDHLNRIMEREGIEVRFDARKLKERGIDREAQIHIGPTAKSLTGRDHAFESRDGQRGDRTLPYTLMDQGSRAEHNQSIIDANRRKESEAQRREPEQRAAKDQQAEAKGREQEAFQRMMASDAAQSRENVEKRELREAQKQTRQAMYQEQQRDRDALRKLHDAQKEQHQQWARQHYAKTRAAAFASVKEQTAGNWSKVRAIDDRKERARKEVLLKEQQKAHYAKECDKRIAEARPQKDVAWKAMLGQQETERLALRGLQRDEAAAMARQQIAERLAVHEKFRAETLQKQTQRIEKHLSAQQGMVAQQRAANATIRLRDRAGQTKVPDASAIAKPQNPHEAARAFMAKANHEQQNQTRIRGALTAQRETNLRQAAATAPERKATQIRGGPGRAIIVDSQTQARQAAQSGRSLTDAERANASPDVKERLSARDRRAAERQEFISGLSEQKQDRDKGRTGGGRGR